MAYRRSISTRVSLLTQRFHPSFSYIFHNDDSQCQPPSDPSRPIANNFLQQGYHNSNMHTTTTGFSYLFRRSGCSSFSSPLGLGSSLYSYSSSAIGEGSDKIEYMGDIAEILTDKSVEAAASHAPIISEVAIAAADSFVPIAFLQYIIDGVHSLTGLNWWSSIVLTTLMIRVCTVPLLINQLKASSKLALMRPQLEEIKLQMQDMAMDPKAFAEGQKRMKALFKEHGVTPFSPMKGLLIQGPVFISFFLAITNMVEKVPSFKEGGAFWFTDLTTPDSLYIFPVLTSMAFLISVEFNMQEGMEGNPVAGHMKTFSRVIGVLTIPLTMNFAKGIFCYWLTSSVFSLAYGLVLKRPQVKKLLNLPEIPAPPPTTTKPASVFSLFPNSKESPSPNEPSKIAERMSSSSVISQRLRSLEKQVKGKKKNKKR